ncbi:MAG: hypothetical protein H6715_01890 [Myxococcales bacterium]|nr:hypothetical protein [Myxococcales bacterium]
MTKSPHLGLEQSQEVISLQKRIKETFDPANFKPGQKFFRTSSNGPTSIMAHVDAVDRSRPTQPQQSADSQRCLGREGIRRFMAPSITRWSHESVMRKR